MEKENLHKGEHVHDETCNHPRDNGGQGMAEQEKFIKLSMLEQQARQIQQQLELIDQQMIELQLLKMSLDELNKTKINEEIFASIGRNIFVKAELKSKDLLIDTGAKTIVKKNIDETKELIDKDISSLTETRDKIIDELNQVAAEIQKE